MTKYATGRAETTKMGPNNARRVVWALGEYYFIFTLLVLILSKVWVYIVTGHRPFGFVKCHTCPRSQDPLTKPPSKTQKKNNPPKKKFFLLNNLSKFSTPCRIFFLRSQPNMLNSKFCQVGHRSHPLLNWIEWSNRRNSQPEGQRQRKWAQMMCLASFGP